MARRPRRSWFHSAPKRLSQRRSARLRATLETLEERSLLASFAGPNPPPTEVAPVWQFAWDRAADLAQYSPEEINTAAGWVIRLNDSASTASLPGTTQRLDGLPNAYVWNPPAEVAPGDAPALLALANSVQSYYPLVQRQQIARTMPNDPMIAQQWHLKNTGQTGGTAGEDANVEPVWTQGITGAGVTIGIVDDGLQWSHPDLAANYVAADSYDFNYGDSDPTPSTADPHGTSAAGVAAARGNNNVGVAGAAYNASLAGLRLISLSATDTQEAAALAYHQQSIDIYSNSWGPSDNGATLESPGPATLSALQNAVTTGRGGLGNIYVWAAGNGLQNNDNVNYDGYANSRYVIAVSAVGHNGTQSYYSEPGAPILVAAYSNDPGIVTTDLVGSSGYSSSDYATDFGGTSSATPLVSGVVALMLEANPNLTWRDVRQVLARSASKNNPGDSGWTLNAGGHDVSHKYGYGAIDADAAVALAKIWNTLSPEVSYSSAVTTVNLQIPDNNTTGLTSTISVPTNVRLESVEVVFNASHSYRGDLEIVLTSPSGTQSVLTAEHLDGGDNYSNWVFSSARYLDELSAGNWTLKVRDLESQDTGTFQNWSLRLYGTPGDSDYGDLPASYELASSARHGQLTGLRLGASKDAESGPSTPLNASGDGADEDGVELPATITGSGGVYNYTVNVAGGAGKLNAWIDFNRDGDFDDAGERIATDTAVTVGANTLSFTSPAGLSSGVSYARFRLNSTGGLSTGGPALDGEVEDYGITVDSAAGGTLSAALVGGALNVTDVDSLPRSNHFTVSRSGSVLSVHDDNEVFQSTPAGAVLSDGGRTLSFDLNVTPLNSLAFNGAAGNDWLTVDLNGGDVLPDLGLQFNGGAGSNSLNILGGTQGAAIYTFTSADDGLIGLTNYGWITLDNVSALSNTGAPSSMLAELPATATVTLSDDATAGNGIMRLSGVGVPTTDFQVPSGGFVVHGAANALTAASLGDFVGDVTLGVSAAPLGSLTVNVGLLLAANKNFSVRAGAVNLPAGISGIQVAGTGTLQISAGSLTQTAAAKLQTAGGALDIAADTINWNDLSVVNAGTGVVSLRPLTAGRGVNLGGADGAELGLTNNELLLIAAGQIRIGDAATGAISVTSAISRPPPLPQIELTTGAKVNFLVSGTEFFSWVPQFAAGTKLGFAINGVGSLYDQMNGSLAPKLTGTELVLSGSYQPGSADSFTLISSSVGAVEGTFNNLPEGSFVTVNGGANVMRITYFGGDGNDVVLMPANATVGGTVWRDSNANGQFDVGEPTVAGAVAELFLGGVSQGVRVTGADGRYEFKVGSGSSFVVEFRKPPGYAFTSRDVGPDATDSDATVTTGQTTSFSVAGGGTDLTRSAGLTGAAPGFGWAATSGPASSFNPGVNTVARDAAGSVFFGGNNGSALALYKLTAAGAIQRAVTAGSSSAVITDLALTPNGDVYVVGTYDFSLTFPGQTLTAIGSQETFIARYTNDLNFVWARRLGASSSSYSSSQAFATSVAVDSAGNTYTALNFTGNIDADPGTATDSLFSSAYISFYTSSLVVKLDAAGNRVWRDQFNWSENDTSVSPLTELQTTADGKVILAGHFRGLVDLDPGPGTISAFSNGQSDPIVLALNGDGTYAWSAIAGGRSWGAFTGLAVAPDGAIYAAADITLTSETDLDPGPAEQIVQTNAFVWKLTGAGEMTWVRSFNVGATFNEMHMADAAADTAGNVYVTGRYGQQPDFDPGPGTKIAPYGAFNNPFVLQLTSAGEFDNVALFPQSSGYTMEARALAAGSTPGDVILGGYTNDARNFDFDPTADVFTLTTSFSGAPFAARLHLPYNLAPTINNFVFNASTLEDTPTVGLGFSVSDFESGSGPLTLSATSASALFPPGSFAFSGTGGTRTLIVTPAPDQFGTASVTITVTDPNGATATTGVTINVTQVNDPPVFSVQPALTRPMNSGPQSVSNWATGTAGPANESGQAIIYLVQTSAPEKFLIPPALAANGTLTFTPAVNQAGDVTVTVTAQDNGGTASGGVDTSTAKTFVISLVPPVEPPTISDLTDLTILEDSATAVLPFTIGDVTTSAAALTVSVMSNNPTLIPSGNYALGGTGANRTLQITPAANQFGTAIVEVRVTDANGEIGGDAFTLTVSPVNDVPSFVKGADQIVYFATTSVSAANWATSISAGPANEASQGKTFVVVGNTNPSLFDVQPSVSPTGTLSFTKATGTFGSATISLALQDDGGTANGGVDTSAVQTFVITVDPDMAAPTVTGAPTDRTILEDANTGDLTFTIGDDFVAPGSLTLTKSSSDTTLVPTANITLGGSGANRTVRVTPVANRFGSSLITIGVADNSLNLTSFSFLVTVLAVNDIPTFTVGASQFVDEDAGPQSIANWITVSSAGALETSQSLTYSVTNNTNAALFAAAPVVSASGTLTFTPAANAEGSATITLVLIDDGGTDNGGQNTSTSKTFTIWVSGINDAPFFTKGADVVVNEDANFVTIPAWATGISPGAAGESGQTLTFSLSTNNSSLFVIAPAINSTTGALTFAPAANKSGTATVTITLSDNGGTLDGGQNTAAAVTFVITVNPVNDAPTWSGGSNITINEDAAAQSHSSFVFSLSPGPTDETSQTLSTSIGGNNRPDLFAVQPTLVRSGTSATLSYTPAANMNGTARITALVTDNGGMDFGGVDTATVAFDIIIRSINDAPVFALAGTTLTVLEDAGPQSVANWATGISPGPAPEAAQALTFTVTNFDNSLFSVQPTIDVATGTLTFTPAPNANGSTTVTVKLIDNGGTSLGGVDTLTRTFTLAVTSVNDVPTFIPGANQTVNEDVSTQFVFGWATNVTAGATTEFQTLTFQVTQNTNAALFSAGPTISSSGTLQYSLAANAWGVAEITIVLKDNGGTANGGVDTTAPAVFTITVNSLNDRPTFTPGASQTILEDAGPQTVVGWAAGMSPGPADEAGQTLTFNVVTGNPSWFTAPPAIAADGTLTYTPAPNASGVAVFTVTLVDNGGTANGGLNTSIAIPRNITITAVNDAPVFVGGSNIVVDEDAAAQTIPGWATGISAGNSFETQTLTFNVTNNTNAALFAVAPAVNAAGTLSFTPAANAFGTATITLTLSDDGGTTNGGVNVSPPQTFVITVNAVNDPPTFVAGAAPIVDTIAAGPQTLPAWASITAGPLEASQPLTVTITGNTRPELFSAGPTLAADGTLTFTPSGVIGSADITVTIADDDGAGNVQSIVRTFTIQIAHTVRVSDFQVGGSGVRFTLTDPIVVANLNLFASTSRGPADVTLVGPSGTVPGSLIVNADDKTFDFVATTGVLAPGSYTFTLRSAANGLVTAGGELLDGNGDFTAGGDYVRTFTVTAPPVGAVTVDLPNITRGPDQAINLPATSALGIPLTVSNGADVSSLSFELRFDTGLLNITGVTLPASAPVGSAVQWSLPSAGVLTGTLTFGSPLAAGAQVVAYLQANVPVAAASRYGERAALDLTNVVLTNSTAQTIPALEDDAVQANVYFGDVGRNGRYDSFDVQQASRMALRLDSGFDLHPLLDSTLIGDFNDNRRIDSFDVQRLSRLALRLSVTEVPPLPSPLPGTTNTGRFDDPETAEPPTKPDEPQPQAPPESLAPVEPVMVSRHNAAEGRRADINNDGGVDGQDVLFAIYYYNRSPDGTLPAADDSPQLLLDVTNDGCLDPQDILTAIVDLNARSTATGEGEASLAAAADDDDSLAELLALDLIAERDKKARER